MLRWCFRATCLDASRILLLSLIGGLVLCPAAPAQQVDLEKARQYADRLESSFWEQAWVRHLEERAGRNGTLSWVYADRQRLNELVADYQRALGQADGFWTNLQVQDYLQRRLLAVQPNPMMPGRPGAFRLRVLSTTTPNALALNDGTIILSTGLLTALKTEAQLHAVLAHEIAHVVLDHALTTYRANKQSSRARNLLGSILGGVTSVVAPGLGRRPLESTIYDLSSGLATQYLNREFIAAAGLEYTQKQERAANRLAQEWLLAHDQPPAALHTALRTLHRVGLRTRSTHGASFPQSHPSTDTERREYLATVIEENGGDPSVLDTAPPDPDSTYDTRLAAVLEHEGELDLAARRFHAARSVLNRALRTPWTTPQTYLFAAIAARNTTITPEGTAEALALLDRAEAEAGQPEPRIEAERALLRIRQNQPEQARRHLARCLTQIDEVRARADTVAVHDSLQAWATRMQVRLKDQE